MRETTIAILLTCHNRKDKTIRCLKSFYDAQKPQDISFDVYLVDDNSTDGTTKEVKSIFPDVHIIPGTGSLFWAGGMRLAWETALSKRDYDAFLLLNDDVVLYKDFMNHLIDADIYCKSRHGRGGIYSGATVDNTTNKITYGAEKITINNFLVKSYLLEPKDYPLNCNLTNANILWIDKQVVNEIGIFDNKYTHGIADFDYSLRALEKGIPVYLAANIGGICIFDHGNNWKSAHSSLKERIQYLKSPKGLAYKEYLFYIKRHFPLYLPYSFTALWLKTLAPILWDKFKA